MLALNEPLSKATSRSPHATTEEWAVHLTMSNKSVHAEYTGRWQRAAALQAARETHEGCFAQNVTAV